MATVSDRDTIDRLIALDGRNGLTRAIKIVEYINHLGMVCWGVVYQNDSMPNRYQRESDYVRHPKVIWQQGDRRRSWTRCRACGLRMLQALDGSKPFCPRCAG